MHEIKEYHTEIPFLLPGREILGLISSHHKYSSFMKNDNTDFIHDIIKGVRNKHLKPKYGV